MELASLHDEARLGGDVIVATYNVHRCVGKDGRQRPERIASVLAELGADILALQEVEAGFHGESDVDQFEFLARSTGMEALAGPTLESASGRYGNALLTRREVSEVSRIELPAREREEPRGAITALVEAGAGRIRVVATHFGLDRRRRRAQAARLADWLAQRDDGSPVVVLGDLNSVSGRSLAPLRARVGGRPPSLRSFPAHRPVLPLDRIWARPRSLVVEVAAHRSELARVASDHLPIRAQLRLED